MRSLLLFTLLLSVSCALSAGEPIRVLAWNIESGGSETNVIIDQLKRQMPKYDVVALSEVPSAAIQPIAQKLGWKHFGGSRGGEDRLMIAWSDRFESSEQVELRKGVDDREFPTGNNRSPIYVKLKDRESGLSLIVMNNHLTRGKEENRNLQAELLSGWVKSIDIPTIAVGDYNMDYDFKTRKGNAAFDIMQKDGHWKWIEPNELIDTNWADSKRDGKDDYPDSMLDFVFVNQAARKLNVSCEVVVRPGDFPDDEKTSDHRPVLAQFGL